MYTHLGLFYGTRKLAPLLTTFCRYYCSAMMSLMIFMLLNSLLKVIVPLKLRDGATYSVQRIRNYYRHQSTLAVPDPPTCTHLP